MNDRTGTTEALHFLFAVTTLCAAQASNNPWLLGFAVCVGVLMFRWSRT